MTINTPKRRIHDEPEQGYLNIDEGGPKKQGLVVINKTPPPANGAKITDLLIIHTGAKADERA